AKSPYPTSLWGNTEEMPIKRCPLGSPECALFIVAQLLLRLLGGKSSAATKTHSGEQKSNSKGIINM
ncbi:hypothetical protein, partial [Pseudoalteromonas piscicida]|uniref:hypothetical protein n=1 Tax=Pseudoalteromonas piscicida TaxID=43662 RepID=UPI00117BB11D